MKRRLTDQRMPGTSTYKERLESSENIDQLQDEQVGEYKEVSS